ncbi:BamA/TamA family outer membrane protein [Enterovibrio nigricans]|nr:BamA/TamA family outer membrane protein [Enterovibrio nigricans]
MTAMAEKQPPKALDIEIVPFAFSTEVMGFSAGMAGLWKGAGQPQASLFAAGLGSSTGTWLSFIAANNYVLAADSRWLFGGQFYEADYKQFDYYLGNAASNDSTFDDRIKLDSREAQHHLSVRYILPWGAAQENPIRAALIPKRSVDGNVPWNSGVSSIDFRPFYKAQNLTGVGADIPSAFSDNSEVWGLETRFKWDNRDSTTNPTQGSLSEFIVTVDPGSDNRANWWKWEASQSWYWRLGEWEAMAKEQVFALNIYTADTPSWNNITHINGQAEFNRPPEFASVRLGGLYRLRSFQTGRFADRSALSYSMEYRVIPEWQPLGDVPVFNWYDVPWWQWVLFADVGRVADDYNLKTLHEDMKWSAGAGMRFQVEGIVVRSEMAWGSEEGLFRVMINQPF